MKNYYLKDLARLFQIKIKFKSKTEKLKIKQNISGFTLLLNTTLSFLMKNEDTNYAENDSSGKESTR